MKKPLLAILSLLFLPLISFASIEMAFVAYQDTSNYDFILSDGYSNKIVHTDWSCDLESDTPVALSESLDWLDWGDQIFSGSESCDVESAHDVDSIGYLYKTFDNDKAVLLFKKTPYVVELGSGCASAWRYEESNVYLNVGSYLSGVSDYLILPNGRGDCRIWDAKKIN